MFKRQCISRKEESDSYQFEILEERDIVPCPVEELDYSMRYSCFFFFVHLEFCSLYYVS